MNNIICSTKGVLQSIAFICTTILVLFSFWYKVSLKSSPAIIDHAVSLIFFCLLIILFGIFLYQQARGWREKTYQPFITAPSLMLAAYMLTALITTLSAYAYGETLSRRGLDLQTIVISFAIYISIILFIETKKDLKKVVLVWITTGIIIALAGWHQIIFPQYEPGSLKNNYGQAFTKKIPPLPVLQKIFIKNENYRQTSGLFEHPNIFSRTLIPFISISLVMLFVPSNKYKHFAIFLFFIFPFLFTISRAAFLAIIAGCLIFGLVLLLRKYFNIKQTNGYLYAFIVLTIFYIFFLYQHQRLISKTLFAQFSISSRIEGTVIMRKIFAKYPERILRGNGLILWDEIYAENIFIKKYNRKHPDKLPQQNTYAYIQKNKSILYTFNNTSLRTTDNAYLNILLTDGLLGFTFFLAFILSSLHRIPGINNIGALSPALYATASFSLAIYYLADAFFTGDILLLIIIFAFLNKSKQLAL